MSAEPGTGMPPDVRSADVADLAEVLDGGRGDLLGRLTVDAMPLAEVRVWLRGLVAAHGWSAPLERTLLLLATELAANAQNHGPPGGQVVLTVAREGGSLRVAVDDDAAAPPVVRRPSPDAGNGRGMLLVERLAEGWGTAPRVGGGKVVWFTLPVEEA